jgi:carbonic anhydrase
MMQSKVFIAALAIICVASVGAFAFIDRDAETPDEAVVLLKEGNARFLAKQLEDPGLKAARMKDAAAFGQKPFAAVLGCSDSRVPVVEIFDRGIGDIFVIRVAGNVAMDPVVIGSAEYAVGNLGAPVLVILGHTGCGAVKAAISGASLEGGMRDIQKKIEPAVATVKDEHPGLKDAALTTAVVKANVMQAKKDLLASSREISRLVSDGKIKVVPAVYDLETGVVEWLE